MFDMIRRKLNAVFSERRDPADSPPQLTGVLDADLGHFSQVGGADLIVRQLALPTERPTKAALVYLDSMNDQQIIGDMVLQPLLAAEERLRGSKDGRRTAELLGDSVLKVGNLAYSSDVDSLRQSLVSGDCLLLVEGSKLALTLGTAKTPERAISEPNTERLVRGSQAGFTEHLTTNVSLIRRRLRDASLTLEKMTIGERSKTQVGIVYLRDLVQDELVEEVKHRLSRISIDQVPESGYIEQLIEDNPWSLFAQVGNSERPDVVVAKLLSGRVGVIVDGTPVVLTVPMLFVEGLQSAEDYYSRMWYASLVRMVRFAALFLATALPALYVALVSYHQELIPTPLLVTMAAAAEGTPFPAYLEVLVLGVIFEILREASLRLPANVGQAVSIVGTLVIGQAAIQAGLFGAPVIIVAAVTALSSFVATPHADASAILRLLLAIAAGFSGLFGMLIASLFLLVHLCSLKSFGALYLSPLAPFNATGQLDVLLRAPLWLMRQRPAALGAKDKQRFAKAPAAPEGKKR